MATSSSRATALRAWRNSKGLFLGSVAMLGASASPALARGQMMPAGDGHGSLPGMHAVNWDQGRHQGMDRPAFHPQGGGREAHQQPQMQHFMPGSAIGAQQGHQQPHMGGGMMDNPFPSNNSYVMQIAGPNGNYFVNRDHHIFDANGKPYTGPVEGQVRINWDAVQGFSPNDIHRLGEIDGQAMEIHNVGGVYEGRRPFQMPQGVQGGQRGGSGHHGWSHNGWGNDQRSPVQTTYTVDQLKTALGSIAGVSSLQVGVPTTLTVGQDGEQTVTGTFTLEKNGKIQVNSTVARVVSSTLNGTSTDIDNPRDKGLAIDNDNLTKMFSNDPTGVGVIKGVPVGQTKAVVATLANDANGEQQASVRVTNLGNGKYIVTGTQATPTRELIKLTGLPVTYKNGQITLYADNECGCVVATGTYKGHQYKIDWKNGKPHFVDQKTFTAVQQQIIIQQDSAYYQNFATNVIAETGTIYPAHSESAQPAAIVPAPVVLGLPLPPSPMPPEHRAAHKIIAAAVQKQAAEKNGGCVNLCTFESWAQQAFAAMNTRLATDEASIAALKTAQGQGGAGAGDPVVTQAIAAAQRQEDIVGAAQVVAYAAQQQAGSAATSSDTSNYSTFAGQSQTDLGNTDATIASISSFATPNAAVGTLKAETDELKGDVKNLKAATSHFYMDAAAAQKATNDQVTRLWASFEKFKHEVKTDLWIIGGAAFGALALGGAALWAALRPRGTMLPPTAPVTAAAGSNPKPGKTYDLEQDFKAAQDAVTQWAAMGGQADFATKLSAEAALNALHNSVMRDRRNMNLAAQAADYLLDVESQFRGHLNMNDATEVFSFIKADKVQDAMLRTRVRAIQRVWAPAA